MSPLLRCLLVLTILSIYTAIGVTVPAEAGPLNGVSVKVGTYKGGQSLNFTGTELVKTSDIWTLTGGVGLEWKLKRKSSFILMTEFFYVEKNTKIELNDPAINSNAPSEEITSTYLSVPLIGKLRTAGQDAGLYFLLGLSLEFMLDHNDVAYADQLKPFSLGVQAGLGFDIPAGDSFGFLLEVRYAQDITNIYDGPEDNVFGLNEVRNRGLYFLGGVHF